MADKATASEVCGMGGCSAASRDQKAEFERSRLGCLLRFDRGRLSVETPSSKSLRILCMWLAKKNEVM
jgi:hypothetical protein